MPLTRDLKYNSVVGEIPNRSWGRPAIDELFRALSDPTRRAILRLLRDGDLSAGEIAAQFPLAKSTLSGHFTILRHAGLIVATKQGTTINYSLSTSAIEELAVAVLSLLGTGESVKQRQQRAVSAEQPIEKGDVR